MSGERDLLDELRSAHATRQLSAEGLARTISAGAAQLLRLEDGGRIEAGARADLTVFKAERDLPVRDAGRRLARRRAPDDDRRRADGCGPVAGPPLCRDRC